MAAVDTLRDLVGLPYRLGAAGPDAVDCWGLLRLACRRLHGVELPDLQGHDPAQVALAARAQGWRRVDATALRTGDAVHMRNAAGLLHVGMAVHLRRRLHLLHAVAGGSVCQPMAELPALGFGQFVGWRLQP